MTISAIIVIYNPNHYLLQKTIDSIYNQVNTIIIVNNSDSCYIHNKKNIITINLMGNFGIAYAQNRGIEKAQELNSTYILLSDQDTIYPNNYVNQMLSTNNYSENIICPIFYDNIKNEISPIMITKFSKITNIYEPTYVAHAISSGTIIKTIILNEIGLMNESLFIDYVDFEWCWRATHLGFRISANPFAKINHQLGDGYKKIINKKVTLRSNQRYYYIIRNGFYLSFYTPFLRYFEKTLLLKRTIYFSIGVFLLKKQILPVLLKAFIDALFKRMGKLLS